MQVRPNLLALVAVIVLASFAGAQNKVIKHVPAKRTSAASGQDMYTNYCAVCHGKDGKGNGPAADALKKPATDLTTLAKNNGGTYPSLRVVNVIRGDANLPSHGSKDMPVWGPLFWHMSQGHESEVQQRVVNLDQYIKGLQAK